MESYIKIFFITLLCFFVLFTSEIEGRKDPETYWGEMMKEQPMPEAIKDFINQREAIKDFIKDFDPIPNISVYHDNVINLKELKSKKDSDCNSQHHDDELASKKKVFDDEFEPIPNVSVYSD
ncbi:organ-specific protein S2 isoform X2 [Spinacia oleracea]|uniref:Organ-specific protein S2 isoform X2 n=1 Tax=Spinacia oleracea TaxID=3562 RepID=A0A9R0J548_SPIOL|nr:organ-specific protein S2-like isoform X2 [Spinacia oleracea]